jgi:hypothetical protein
LLTRGIWLIVAELVLARCFAYQFNFDYQITLLLVLWAAGWAMITLAALVHLPVSVVTAIGALLIAGHNLFDSVKSTNPLWTILHQQAPVLSGDHVVFVAYPLIPWIGVTFVGYGLGQLYSWTTDERRAWLLRLGLATSLAFVVIRGINGVWQSDALDAATDRAVYRALVHERDQATTVTALSVDDARPGTASSVGGRRADAASAPAGTDVREGAAVLLPDALCFAPRACGCRLLPALRNRPLDV